MDRTCRHCGEPLPAEAKFCMHCGRPAEVSTPDDRTRHSHLSSAAPAALARKMRLAPVAGERRMVTALFADVVGSTTLAEALDPEEWTGIMNKAFDLMSRAAYRYEGTIAGLWGDEILVFFGAPVAHEDDPERAVRAALDMNAAIDTYAQDLKVSAGIDFQIRIGINSGLVVVGQVGSDLKYEYTAMGDAINVASRMKAAARPGAVLIAEPTYRFVSSVVDLLDLGAVKVKGKDEPVRTFEVVGLKTRPGPKRGIAGLGSPLVGRDRELARLRALTESVDAGAGRAAVVFGEPGIGKTRLIKEWRESAVQSEANLTWIEGHCIAYNRELPYRLLLDLVRALFGIPETAEDDTKVALQTRLRDLLGNDWAERAAFLAHLLSLPLDEHERGLIERLDASVLRARYLETLRQVLRAQAKRRPLVIVCEDVHWADSSSVDILTRLLPLVREAPILLTLVLRPDRDAPGWQLVTAAQTLFGDSLTEISLEPLTEENSQRLLAHLLAIESLPAPLRESILGKSEGNPFFVEEIVRMLIERGAIIRKGASWVGVGKVEALDIPDTLQGLLRARIDHLPQEARRTLLVASVIGRQFSSRVLEEVLAEMTPS